MESKMPERNDCEEFPNAEQKKILKGVGIGGVINGGLGIILSLTPLFSQLVGPSTPGSRAAAAGLVGFVIGAFLGLLIASPKNGVMDSSNGNKTLDQELASRSGAERKRADTLKLAEANKQGVHFNL